MLIKKSLNYEHFLMRQLRSAVEYSHVLRRKDLYLSCHTENNVQQGEKRLKMKSENEYQ